MAEVHFLNFAGFFCHRVDNLTEAALPPFALATALLPRGGGNRERVVLFSFLLHF